VSEPANEVLETAEMRKVDSAIVESSSIHKDSRDVRKSDHMSSQENKVVQPTRISSAKSKVQAHDVVRSVVAATSTRETLTSLATKYLEGGNSFASPCSQNEDLSKAPDVEDDNMTSLKEVVVDAEDTKPVTDESVIQTSKKSDLCTRKTDSKSMELIDTKQKANGRLERLFADGRIEVTFSNGTVKETHPDGAVSIKFNNGDIKETCNGGHVRYFYADAGAWQTTFKDGSELLEFNNGQVERHYPDGTKEILFPDGHVRVSFPDGTEQEFEDGEFDTRTFTRPSATI